MLFEDVGSVYSTDVNNDYNVCRLLRLVSDMVTWMDLCFSGVGRVSRVILS